MAYNFPHIELSEAEEMWLREVYSQYKNGQQLDFRTLKLKLKRRLPRDFNPGNIDRRLLQYGNQITLLGVSYVDPQTDLIDKTDRVIRAIADSLENDPS